MRIATLALALGLAAPPATAADLVLHHGRIWTGDPRHPAATAIAIEGNRIIAVGSDAQVLALADADTRRIDLGGRRVVPGINDAHTHLTRPLPGEVLDLPRDADAASVRTAIAALPTGGDRWISADIDIPVLLDPGMRRTQLDALQPTRPVLLTAWTGHGMLVNTAAQQALGLATEQAPPGGWLGREDSGRFDGRVYEYAQWSPRTRLPGQPAALRERIAAEAAVLLQLGITSIQNMAIGTPLPELVAAWQEAGTPLRLRAVRTPLARAPGEAPDHPDLPVDDPDRPRITVAGTKWILDGTPMERGAAMRQPYPDGSRGHQNFSPAQVRALLQECLSRGDQPLLHVAGDATLATVLDAMESLAPADAWRRLRPRIEHGEGLAADLVPRTAALGIVLVQNPSHFMMPPDEAAYLQAHRLQPLADVAAAGIPLALGSDGPPSPWLNMMFAIAPASRPDQALDREQVLAAYTHGSAFAEFREHEKGILAPRYLADLAVLSQDVLDEALPARALPATTSVLTVVDGQVAWRDPAL